MVKLSILIWILSLLLFGCSENELISPTLTKTVTTPDDQKDPTETKPLTGALGATRTLKPTHDPDHTPTNHTGPVITNYDAIPIGEHIVFYDWRDHTIRLLSENGGGQDLILVNQGGSLSTDIKQLSYVKNFDIFVMDFVTNNLVHIPTEIKCYRSPSWSPEGDRLAVECEDGIYVYSISDKSHDQLTDWGQQSVDSFISPIWSPDGKWIAYSYRQLTSLQLTPEDGVYLIEVDCLTEDSTCKERTQGVYFPYSNDMIKSWSPDSQYLGVFDQTKSIRILDISTHEVRKVIENLDDIDGLAWSPDGNWLAYSIGGDIYKISSGGGEPILLAEDKGYLDSWISINADN